MLSSSQIRTNGLSSALVTNRRFLGGAPYWKLGVHYG